jgi:hypothetical protein
LAVVARLSSIQAVTVDNPKQCHLIRLATHERVLRSTGIASQVRIAGAARNRLGGWVRAREVAYVYPHLSKPRGVGAGKENLISNVSEIGDLFRYWI